MYGLVDTWVRDREGKPGVGMIEQSLCHHLHSQLTEYYRLIAILESQMSLSSKGSGSNTDDKYLRASSSSAESDIRTEESGLTLRRLDVWVNEWRLRMRMMSVCVEAARGVSFPYGESVTYLTVYRYEGRSPRQLDSQLHREWRSFRAPLHRSTS